MYFLDLDTLFFKYDLICEINHYKHHNKIKSGFPYLQGETRIKLVLGIHTEHWIDQHNNLWPLYLLDASCMKKTHTTLTDTTRSTNACMVTKVGNHRSTFKLTACPCMHDIHASMHHTGWSRIGRFIDIIIQAPSPFAYMDGHGMHARAELRPEAEGGYVVGCSFAPGRRCCRRPV